MLESLTKKCPEANFLLGHHKAEEYEKHEVHQKELFLNTMTCSKAWVGMAGGGNGSKKSWGVREGVGLGRALTPVIFLGVEVTVLSLVMNWQPGIVDLRYSHHTTLSQILQMQCLFLGHWMVACASEFSGSESAHCPPPSPCLRAKGRVSGLSAKGTRHHL